MSYRDQYHDPGFATLRHLLERHPGVAELVKTAEIEDHLEDVPEAAFALATDRRFPVHSPAQAALSYLYAKTAAAPAPVLAAIKVALDAYGVAAEAFEPVEVKLASVPDEDRLAPQGPPLRDAGEVKAAEAWLTPQVERLGVERRAELFRRLYKAAEATGAELAPLSYKYAGATQTDAPALARDLRARARATKEAAVAGAFDRLADEVAGKAGRVFGRRDVQVKVAAAIADLDARGGLVRFYDRGLPDPLRAVFNTEKRADVAGLELGGYSFPMTKLMSLHPSFYGDVLGPDVVREIAPTGSLEPEKLAMVVETLPLDLKRVLATALRSAGK